MRFSILCFFLSIVFFLGFEIQIFSQNSVENKNISKLWTESEKQFLIDGLKRTELELITELQNLTDRQWIFKEDPDRWSIAEIVEHLEIQDEMYYREIYLVTKTPQSQKYITLVKGKDQEFLKYASDTVRGKSGFMLEPIGRFCTKEKALDSFSRVRGEILEFVENTELDLRRFFTFRRLLDDGSLADARLWDIRDLHQLLLTTIAHSDRHLSQLRKVKKHKNFPN